MIKMTHAKADINVSHKKARTTVLGLAPQGIRVQRDMLASRICVSLPLVDYRARLELAKAAKPNTVMIISCVQAVVIKTIFIVMQAAAKAVVARTVKRVFPWKAKKTKVSVFRLVNWESLATGKILARINLFV